MRPRSPIRKLFVRRCVGVGSTDSSDRETSQWYITRFTPRGARSAWSQVNVQHLAELEAEGRLQLAGRAHVDAARAEGRWYAAYAPASSGAVPPELQSALEASPAALAAFANLDAASRYSMCYRVATAKRADT